MIWALQSFSEWSKTTSYNVWTWYTDKVWRHPRFDGKPGITGGEAFWERLECQMSSFQVVLLDGKWSYCICSVIVSDIYCTDIPYIEYRFFGMDLRTMETFWQTTHFLLYFPSTIQVKNTDFNPHNVASMYETKAIFHENIL